MRVSHLEHPMALKVLFLPGSVQIHRSCGELGTSMEGPRRRTVAEAVRVLADGPMRLQVRRPKGERVSWVVGHGRLGVLVTVRHSWPANRRRDPAQDFDGGDQDGELRLRPGGLTRCRSRNIQMSKFWETMRSEANGGIDQNPNRSLTERLFD
jgi:hypothetical protein